MRRFDSPYGSILLTEERLKHIVAFHSDIRGCLQYFDSTLGDPDHTRDSKHDPDVVICYRYLPRRKRYLAIVVHIQKKFVVTAYLAKKLKRDTL